MTQSRISSKLGSLLVVILCLSLLFCFSLEVLGVKSSSGGEETSNKDKWEEVEEDKTRVKDTLVQELDKIGAPAISPCPLGALSNRPEKIVFGDQDSYSSGKTKSYKQGEHPPLALATEYGEGRVVAIGHEGFFTEENIDRYDNLKFGLNAINWLDKTDSKRVLYDTRSWPYSGYGGEGVYGGLGKRLIKQGYSVDKWPLNQQITLDKLKQYAVYMICTSWYPFSQKEIHGITQYVKDGGGLFLTGVGWSWVQYQGPLEEYPMNLLANNFEIKFLAGSLHDPTNNIGGEDSYPIFHSFNPVKERPESIKNILVDTYHVRGFPGKGLLKFGNSGQLNFTKLNNPITYEKLKQYDLFVFVNRMKSKLGPKPTLTETKVIQKYVQNGGAALILGEDNYWGLWNNKYPDKIGDRFNISFNSDKLLDPTDYDTSVHGSEGGAERHIVFHNVSDHPVTGGVEKVLLQGSCSLVNQNPEAVDVLAGDRDTYSDSYSEYQKGSFPPVAVALSHGEGRIFFMCDHGWAANVYDNRKFMKNILDWLFEIKEGELPIEKRWWESKEETNKFCKRLAKRYDVKNYTFFRGTHAGKNYVLILLREGTTTKRDVVFGLDMDVPRYKKVFLFDTSREKFVKNEKLVRELYYSHYLSEYTQEIVNSNSGIQKNLVPLHYSELAAGFNNPAVKLTPLVGSMSAGGHGLASFLITKNPSSAVNTLRGQVIEVIAGVAEAEEKKEKMLKHAKDDGRFSDDATSGYRAYQACKRNLEALQLAKKGYSEVIKGPDSIAEKLQKGRTLTKGAFSTLIDILLGEFLPTKGIVETGQYFAYSKEFAEAAQDLMAGHESEEESGKIKGAEYYRKKLEESIDRKNYRTAKDHHLNMTMRTSKALTQLALAYEFQRKALKANEGKIEWEIAEYIHDYMDDISVKDKLATLESRREEMMEWSRRVLFWFLKALVWSEQASHKLEISDRGEGPQGIGGS